MGNSKPNAFSLFVKDMANRKRQRGEQFDYPKLFKELGPQWQSMSDEEKQRYKSRSKSIGSYCSAQPTSTPNPILQIESNNSVAVKQEDRGCKREHEGLELVPAEKRFRPEIPNLSLSSSEGPEQYMDFELLKIRNQCESIVRARESALITTPIYSFSVNVLCKYKDHSSGEPKNVFIPIELSIFAYAINAGKLGEPYHAMIDAGKVPSSHNNKAKDHSVNHKITIPLTGGYPQGARKDYRKIYREILKYTKEGERTLLMSDVRDLAQAKSSLNWLYEKAMEDGGPKLPDVNTWTILPVTEFIAALYNRVYMRVPNITLPKFALHYMLKIKLEGTFQLDYNDALMCEYHRKEENQTPWCTSSCASRTLLNIEVFLEQILKLHTTVEKLTKQPEILPAAPLSLPDQVYGLAQEKASLDMLPNEPMLAIAPPPRKKKEDTLIIASNGVQYENPPDVF